MPLLNISDKNNLLCLALLTRLHNAFWFMYWPLARMSRPKMCYRAFQVHILRRRVQNIAFIGLQEISQRHTGSACSYFYFCCIYARVKNILVHCSVNGRLHPRLLWSRWTFFCIDSNCFCICMFLPQPLASVRDMVFRSWTRLFFSIEEFKVSHRV